MIGAVKDLLSEDWVQLPEKPKEPIIYDESKDDYND